MYSQHAHHMCMYDMLITICRSRPDIYIIHVLVMSHECQYAGYISYSMCVI